VAADRRCVAPRVGIVILNWNGCEAGSSHPAASPAHVYVDTLSKILFVKRTLPPIQDAAWIALHAPYLSALFPLRRRLQGHRFLDGLAPGAMRATMLEALRDSRGIQRVTREMCERFHMRRARSAT
jgi:hypothetical protein